jgi:tetratricopeptide (TPR) repeat protein
MNIRMFSGRSEPTRCLCGTAAPISAVEPSAALAQPNPATFLQQSIEVTMLRRQAMNKAQQGRLDEAIDLLNELITQQPSSADYNNRGLLLFQNGQPTAALEDYNRALALNPKQTKVYNNRANCYAALGCLQEAISDYETAIDLDPANLNAWVNQGITFRDLALYSQAVDNFDLALRFLPILQGKDHPSASSFLEGHIYAERGRTHHLAGDWNCAVADYHRALAVLPEVALNSQISHRLLQQVKLWLDELLTPLMTSH